ncbi:hypothetical protein MKD41_11485 [Lutibacter sp. A64]|uniref:phospholipase D-like domain-containing protein n=1 Tax=Lutibacter sp. A64 TaxID=2918526 RepID=UPI001F062F86|nr:phospholipase D-like domain-containing protein [Lutibacter sp. A64]UMB52954.1 hypothetical protein MKD41_11485 [Lutibacter sp. A64]
MSKFLTGDELSDKLTDIIWNANKYVVIVSPYIKLDNHVKSIFEKIKSGHDIHIILIFGKNEGYRQKSFNKSDYEYFKEFKNISILYNKDLHAKHYCNEKEGLITSLNLYDYSMVNNIEYGVHFTKNILNPSDKLFVETEQFTDELIFKKSEVVFIRKPLYKKRMLGLTKSYQNSKVLFDVSDDFFNGSKYEIKYLKEFDYEEITDVDKLYVEKPKREPEIEDRKESEIKREVEQEQEPEIGYCIRTGEKIPFNPERPFSYKAYKMWVKYENTHYPEKYCHKTGEKSYGKTSMANPVL